jgi:hypothetical protein
MAGDGTVSVVPTVADAVRPALLSPGELADLVAATDEIATWPAGSHVWGQYAEQTDAGVAICRTENASACAPPVAALVEATLRDTASSLLGEAAVAFKDKINYKQPGGAGFRPHQDRLAYPGVDRVLSILVAIDPCTNESGCLWLAGGVDSVLPVDDRGVVRDDVASTLGWQAAPLEPGDAVLLDGLAPHYSEANHSHAARRVLVASYAPAAEGYSREQYYSARAATMQQASASDGRFRISTLADFEGVEVDTPDAATEHCTHAPLS